MSIKINGVEIIPDGINISGNSISIIANGDKSGIFIDQHKITKEDVDEFVKQIPTELKHDK